MLCNDRAVLIVADEFYNKVKIMKKFLFALPVLGLSAISAFAEGAGAFDATTFAGEAATNVTAIAVAIGSLLTAAVAIYIGFLGYRKIREALNKA